MQMLSSRDVLLTLRHTSRQPNVKAIGCRLIPPRPGTLTHGEPELRESEPRPWFQPIGNFARTRRSEILLRYKSQMVQKQDGDTGRILSQGPGVPPYFCGVVNRISGMMPLKLAEDSEFDQKSIEDN